MRVVFVGPSLSGEMDAARKAYPEIAFRPPAACGDLAATALEGATVIGLIDGVFEDTRAVQHKEILFALDRGIPVAGGASMGALRAAECAAFGMVGIGAIFDGYADGTYTDDGDVAQSHGPTELGYPPLNLPLVNALATFEAMALHGRISLAISERLRQTARSLFYKSRTYPAVLEASGCVDLSEISALLDWIEVNGIDQKRDDARKVLNWVDRADPVPAPGDWDFQQTTHWHRLLSEIQGRSDARPTSE